MQESCHRLDFEQGKEVDVTGRHKMVTKQNPVHLSC
jgi:hypothetical protein